MVESFVIVGLFDCDHMHYDPKNEPYFTLHSPQIDFLSYSCTTIQFFGPFQQMRILYEGF